MLEKAFSRTKAEKSLIFRIFSVSCVQSLRFSITSSLRECVTSELPLLLLQSSVFQNPLHCFCHWGGSPGLSPISFSPHHSYWMLLKVIIWLLCQNRRGLSTSWLPEKFPCVSLLPLSEGNLIEWLIGRRKKIRNRHQKYTQAKAQCVVLKIRKHFHFIKLPEIILLLNIN